MTRSAARAKAGVNSIEHAYRVTDSTLALMAKNGVMLVPTDLDTLSVEHYLAPDGEYTDAKFKHSSAPSSRRPTGSAGP